MNREGPYRLSCTKQGSPEKTDNQAEAWRWLGFQSQSRYRGISRRIGAEVRHSVPYTWTDARRSGVERGYRIIGPVAAEFGRMWAFSLSLGRQ
jgi:hypothetical protein